MAIFADAETICPKCPHPLASHDPNGSCCAVKPMVGGGYGMCTCGTVPQTGICKNCEEHIYKEHASWVHTHSGHATCDRTQAEPKGD
jgi:hypothetical protein